MAKRCPPIGAKRTCLHAGQRCKRVYERAYELAGFQCRRRKLVRASEAVLRHGEPVRLGRNGRPTFSRALQIFDKLIAPLPGVKQRPGVVGKSADGTLPILWLSGYRNRLTPAQRAVLDGLVARKARRFPQAGSAVADKWRELVMKARARLAQRYGLKFNHPIKTGVGPFEGSHEFLAFAQPEWLNGQGDKCRVYLTPAGAAVLNSEGQSLAVHEMIHCAQFEVMELPGSPAWVMEGMAAWGESAVMMDWVGHVPARVKDYWHNWIDISDYSLFDREYTAIGFWGLLAHERQNPFALMQRAVRAGPNAYFAVTNGVAQQLQANWGTTLANRPGAGRRWDLFARGNPRRGLGPRHKNPVMNASYFPLQSAQRSGWAAELSLGAVDVLKMATTDAIGYFRPPSGEEIALDGEQAYCAKPDGCTCNGEDAGLRQIDRGKALIGFASAEFQGEVTIQGQSLKEFCKRRPPIPTGGVQVYGGPSEGSPQLIETFKVARCSGKAGGRWTAVATKNGMKLEITIEDYQGPNPNGDPYEITYGQATRIVEFDGPNGPFSTVFTPLFEHPSDLAVLVGMSPDAKVVGVATPPGSVAIRNADSSWGVIPNGRMACTY